MAINEILKTINLGFGICGAAWIVEFVSSTLQQCRCQKHPGAQIVTAVNRKIGVPFCGDLLLLAESFVFPRIEIILSPRRMKTHVEIVVLEWVRSCSIGILRESLHQSVHPEVYIARLS